MLVSCCIIFIIIKITRSTSSQMHVFLQPHSPLGNTNLTFPSNNGCHLVKAGHKHFGSVYNSVHTTPTHPLCPVYTLLWDICPVVSLILLVNKHRHTSRHPRCFLSPVQRLLECSETKGETHLISWARRCIVAITQHNEEKLMAC